MAAPFAQRWRNRPRIGAKPSMLLHALVMVLCAVAIRGNTANALAWVVLSLNGVALFAIAIKVLTDPYFEDETFGPLGGAARWLGAEREHTPFGRLVAWLRRHGLLE